MTTKHSPIRIRALAQGELEIHLYGEIGAWSDEPITAKALVLQLKAAGPASTLRVRLHSAGGDAFEGMAIHNVLKDNPAKVVVHVDGLALSAASVIAMAGDEIRMAPNALMMIHEPWAMAVGDADELRGIASRLDSTADAIATTYAARCGKPVDELRQMMAAETWFSAEQAVLAGFATEQEPEPDAESEDDGMPELRIAAAVRPEALARYRRVPLTPLTVPQNHLTTAGSPPADGPGRAPNTQDDTMNETLIQALNLQSDADEAAVMASIGQLQVRAARFAEVEELTGKPDAEALGTVKAWQAGAAERDQLAAEKSALELAGHQRDFAAALDGAPRKLTPATRAHFQSRFDAADAKAEVLAEVRAFLAVAPDVLPEAHVQPQTPASGAGTLSHNGKTFADLKPIERHNLNRDQPELYRAMREAHYAARA